MAKQRAGAWLGKTAVGSSYHSSYHSSNHSSHHSSYPGSAAEVREAAAEEAAEVAAEAAAEAGGEIAEVGGEIAHSERAGRALDCVLREHMELMTRAMAHADAREARGW